MRLLLFINLIAIVVLAGALARMYQGTPLPWHPHEAGEVAGLPPAPQVDAPGADAAFRPGMAVTPQPNPLREGAADLPPKLVFLTEGTYPPFNLRDASGRLTGFDVDIARALCARLKRDCSIETRRWSRLLPALKHGEGDAVIASMLIPSSGREGPPGTAGIIFSNRYYSTPGHFAARKSEVGTLSAAALNGRRIAVQAGSVHEAYLKAHFPGAAIVALPTLDDAEATLVADKADLLFADRNALLHWTSNGEGVSCCRLVGVDYTDGRFFGAGAGIALREDEGQLRDDIDAALAQMVADGTYAEISTRYFGQSIQ